MTDIAADAAATIRAELVNGRSCDIPASSPLARLQRAQRRWTGPGIRDRQRILRETRSVAIVGASANPTRSSYFVGTYLQQSTGYRLYFVNPNADTILGQPAYASLADLPEVPDVVDVFRRASDVPAVADEAIAVGAKVLWVQLGIWNEQAAIDAEARGLTVVMDRCMKVEHARFAGGLHLMGFETGTISSRRRRA